MRPDLSSRQVNPSRGEKVLKDTTSDTPGYSTTGGEKVAPSMPSMTASELIAGTSPLIESNRMPRLSVSTSFAVHVSCAYNPMDLIRPPVAEGSL